MFHIAPLEESFSRYLWQHYVPFQMFRYRSQQALILQPFPRKQALCISVRPIAQDRHDRVPTAQLFGHFFRRHDIQAAACAQVQPFLVQTPVDHLDALLITDMQRPIHKIDIRLQILRHPALPYPLGDRAPRPLLQFPSRCNVRMQHRARRIGQEALHPPIRHIFQIARDPGQRAARPRRTRKRIHLPTRLIPDLRPRALQMRPPVRHIVELIRPHRVLQALSMALRLMVVILRVLVRDRGHREDLRSEQPQQIDLPLRLRRRHVDDEFVALGATHVRQPDPRVPRRAFDYGPACTQAAAGFGILDDGQRGAVFDAAAWVLEFGFS